jgi:hypothetical protein
MNHIRRLLLAAALLSLAAAAEAQISPPSPANSTVPPCIRLVGSNGTTPSQAFGQFTVVFRDLANNPLPNALIVIDLSGIPEVFLAADQLDPAVVVSCPDKRVTKLTDAHGVAEFCIIGASSDALPPVVLLNGGKIFAEGMLIGSPTINAFDLDGRLGLGAGDLALFLSDFASGNPYRRSDFDCGSGIGANDLRLWLNAFGSSTQNVSASAACP